MAEGCARTPSLDDLFDILSGVTEQRLLSLWYKFSTANAKAKIHQLLYSIISFFLKKKDEAERAARSVLNEMPADRSALYIFNKIQGSGGGAEGEGEASEVSNEEFAGGDSGVLADLASMLAVLVEENLCKPSMRNQACQAAIKAFKSSNQDHSLDLRERIQEFRLLCGPLDFEGEGDNGEVSPLKSIEEPSPSMRSTVACRTNPNQIPTDSLNNSEITVPSHFEISASPTASFISNSCQDNLNSSMADPEENAVNPVNSANITLNNSKNVLNLSSDDYLGVEKVVDSIGARGGEQDIALSVCSTPSSSGDQVNDLRPTQCTGRTSSDQIVTSKSKISGGQGTGDEVHANSISPGPSVDTTKLLTGGQSNSSETMSAQAVDESFENKFYPFVVFHAPEDVEIAESVQVRLESLVKMEGATFFEEFSLPGRSPIKCIEDAVNNSAFTILLLTNSFKNRWDEYKTNIVLINSINNEYKYNTVIPMLPQKSRMPREDIPFALSAINRLDENSRHFERHVRKTFTREVLEKHKKIWLEEQTQKQYQERLSQAQRELQKTLSAQMHYMELCTQLAQMQQLYPFAHPPYPGPTAVNGHTQPVLNPPPYLDFSLLPPGLNPFLPSMLPKQPNFSPFIQPPFQVINPGNGQGGQNVTVSSSTQQQNQGTNIIQIQHAKNVQIGDSNQMTITDSIESTDDEQDGDSDHS
ncbi:TIR domain-containing adapter molecule 1 [Scyliorhinus canicula]|uniref:TIR domain-containing adapter molecule 1 n=1 Tax=Scyliorhinus canicula TaxID=7830 RepID=UPI0018F725F7|nr:TIR domain-containing adapter molecule 1 [Scyliorhinus canicula]XP_038633583.1 TIR domain-containing adapter molecule 1 [Scyliorhinus canicula]